MISLCVVTLEVIEKYFEKIFIESVIKKNKLVSEILLAKADAEPSFYKEWTIGDTKLIKFGYTDFSVQKSEDHGIQHAIGLHACIDRAQNDLIMLSDPDIFFYEGVDEIYHNLMKEHNLNIVGCSHHHSIEHSSTFFPNQINLLMRKSDLPDKQFLENKLRRRSYKLKDNEVDMNTNFAGKFLIPGAIPDYADMFPNKDGLFETGCNLWIINKEKNWKWLSFQTVDCTRYNTFYHKCNIKIPRPQKHKLLYHCNNGFTIGKELDQIELHNVKPSGMMVEERYKKFKQEYNLEG